MMLKRYFDKFLMMCCDDDVLLHVDLQSSLSSCLHSSLVSTGTVTACRLLEWGAASPTPSLPQPVTVARVPASSTSPGGGRQIEEMVGVGFT